MTEQLPIEEDVPIPEDQKSKIQLLYEELSNPRMRVTNSIFVPYDHIKPPLRLAYLQKKLKRKFKQKKAIKNGITGTRIWRIE